MRITCLTAALVAGATVAAAVDFCTLGTSQKAPESVARDYIKFDNALSEIFKPVAHSMIEKRQAEEKPQICKDDELCIRVTLPDSDPPTAYAMCYNSDTTNAQIGGILATLKNGDIVMYDGTKGNVFNNQKPITEHYVRVFSGSADGQPANTSAGTSAATGASKSSGTGSDAATTSAPKSSNTGSVAAASTSPDAATSSQKASEESAAGKLGVEGYWVAAGFGAMAIAMVA